MLATKLSSTQASRLDMHTRLMLKDPLFGALASPGRVEADFRSPPPPRVQRTIPSAKNAV